MVCHVCILVPHVAGIPTSIVPSHSYTPTGLSWFRNRGQAYSRYTVANGGYTPEPGDIIYFKSSRNNNTTNHIGIVTGYSNGTVYTIEGNTSSATISTDGGAVCEKSYSIQNTYIVYICRPEYKNTAKPKPNPTPANWLTGEVKDIVFDAVYYADHHPDLRSQYGTDADALFDYFLNQGIQAGHQASPTFDIRYYVENNEDIRATYGTDYVAAMKHFVSTGINEARVTAEPLDLGNSFQARISFPAAGLNFSLSDTNVITYNPSDSPAQVWTFERHPAGAYRIINSKNRYSLAVDGYDSECNVHIAEYRDSRRQLWYIYEREYGRYVFRSMTSSCCVIDVYGGVMTPSTNVWSYTYNGTDAQLLGIEKLSGLAQMSPVDLGTGFYAKINASDGMNLSLIDENVIIYHASTAAAQVWKFVRQDNSSYHIINQKNGKLLDVYWAKDESGTNVQVYEDNDSIAHKWFIYQSGDKYVFRPACSETRALNVAGNSMAPETNVEIHELTGASGQRFGIQRLENYADLGHPLDLGTDFYAKINASDAMNLSLEDENVIIYPDSTAPAQVWKFVRHDNGSYQIVNQKNSLLLTVAGGVDASCINVLIAPADDSDAQKWYIYQSEEQYVLRPACSYSRVLDVYGDYTDPMTNVQIYTFHDSEAHKFRLLIQENYTEGLSDANMAVLRTIMYAVETGGQVYGQADYSDFTEAYTNTSLEHAITIGAGQWYGPEAKELLNRIRQADPSGFAALDTAGIASDLDSKDWSTYQVSKGSAKATCIQAIISTDVGKRCQDQMMDEQLTKFMQEAAELGVTDQLAQMMCANIRHLGGLSAVKRILAKTEQPYTIHTIYAALLTDTGSNQVGTFRSRNKMVYESLLANFS